MANKNSNIHGKFYILVVDMIPNITYWLNGENALERCLESLQEVCTADDGPVLMGQRRLLHTFRRKVAEPENHHRAR